MLLTSEQGRVGILPRPAFDHLVGGKVAHLGSSTSTEHRNTMS